MFAAWMKYAAAASLVTAAGLTFLMKSPPAGAASAFTETARKLREARTLSYRMSVQVPGQKEPTLGHEFFKDPGLVRSETESPEPAVVIMDRAGGTVLTLDPKAKLAIVQSWKPGDAVKGGAKTNAADAVSHLRKLAEMDGKPVGRKTIGEVEAEGFRVEDAGMTWTVWVDPKAKFPVRMETSFRIDEKNEAPAVLSDFRIDPPLDDALFRLEPPAGYTVTKIDTPIKTGQDALVDLLRQYAEATGGAFPPTKPDDPEAYRKAFPKERWKGVDDPKMIRLVQGMAATVAFLRFELKNAYGYAPKGVKLGDADRVLLWYRPKDAKTYRALFGDLHAEDVGAERLPEKPGF